VRQVPDDFRLEAVVERAESVRAATAGLPHQPVHQRAFRIGGLVETGSVRRQSDGLTVRFNVTDTAQTLAVVYSGILPDLFREGKGVVAQGRLNERGEFTASEVLAKHDENYMPPEAQHALDQASANRSAQTLKP